MSLKFKKDKTGEFITINETKYERKYLRKNLPYIVEFNRKSKDYYLINRDYEYIGYDNVKSLTKIETDIDKTKSDYGYDKIYLYNDGCKPWNDKQYMIDYIKNYLTEINKLNNCKNDNFSLQFDFMN